MRQGLIAYSSPLADGYHVCISMLHASISSVTPWGLQPTWCSKTNTYLLPFQYTYHKQQHFSDTHNPTFQVALDAKKRAFSWGFGGYGRLGHAEPKDEYIPRLIKFFDGHNRGVEKVYCGSTFTIAVSVMGIFLWGQTKRTGEANMYPKPLQDLCGWDVRSVGCSITSIVVAADESVIAWGPSPTYGELVSVLFSRIDVLISVNCFFLFTFSLHFFFH